MGNITISFELNSKTSSDGRNLIFLKLTQNRKRKRISTNIYVNKKYFITTKNARYGKWIKQSFSLANKLNEELKEIYTRAEFSVLELEKSGKPKTIDNLALILSEQETQKDFISFGREVIQRFYNSKKVGNYKKYKCTIDKLEKYLQGKSLYFDDITVSFLRNYEAYLYKIGNSGSTVEKELKVLRATLYRGMDEGLLPQHKNPYFKFKIKAGKAEARTKLTLNEIKKIISADIPQGTEPWHVRNYFLFSFYSMGVRATDIILMKKKNILLDEQKLSYVMTKTGNPLTIKIIPESLEILKLYNIESLEQDEFIFPLLSNTDDYSDPFYLQQRISSLTAKINKNLKVVAKLSDIHKSITTHVARHSIASVMQDSEALSIKEISSLLNHHSISQTETYLRNLSQSKLDESIDKVFLKARS